MQEPTKLLNSRVAVVPQNGDLSLQYLKENFLVNVKMNLDSNTDSGAISGSRDVVNYLF